MGGRAPSHSAAVAACGDESGGKICRHFAKDLIGLLQFAHFAFQSLHLLGLFGADAATLASINLNLLDPFVQRLRCATDLRGNRNDRGPTAFMLLHPTHVREPPANKGRFRPSNRDAGLCRHFAVLVQTAAICTLRLNQNAAVATSRSAALDPLRFDDIAVGAFLGLGDVPARPFFWGRSR